MLDLKPSLKVSRLVLRPSVGKGSFVFTEGSASLKLKLTPFFQGPPGSTEGSLLLDNFLSEFNDESKKISARQNIGLQVIDLGTFN